MKRVFLTNDQGFLIATPCEISEQAIEEDYAIEARRCAVQHGELSDEQAAAARVLVTELPTMLAPTCFAA